MKRIGVGLGESTPEYCYLSLGLIQPVRNIARWGNPQHSTCYTMSTVKKSVPTTKSPVYIQRIVFTTMATILGKRKRQRTPNTAVQVDSDPHSADEADVQAAFRRAFEAKFKPLKTERSKATQPAPSRDLQTAHEEEADSEWSGLSSGPGSDSEDEHLELTDQAGTPTVEIIEHGRNYTRDRHIDRKDHDKFMVRDAC